MKYTYLLYILIFVLVACKKPSKPNFFEIEINNGWTCRLATDSAWIEADVPGNTIADLKYNGVIDSMITVDKLPKIQNLLNRDWEYKVVFDVPLEIIAQDSVYIQFDGIAETAEILLNGVSCLRTQNMFKTYILPCKHLLKEYRNVLLVHFKPSVNLNRNIIGGSDTKISSSQISRKASYFNGSEINPAIPFMGIWKPVKLIAWSGAVIKNVYFETETISPKEAIVVATIDIDSKKPADYTLSFDINNQPQKDTYNVKIKKGRQTLKFKIAIDNPDLWWCNGLGRQVLYEAKVNLLDQMKLVSQKTIQFGIRKIELVEQSDSIGYNFFFKLNNKPVFVKGGAFVPLDLFDFSKSANQYEQVISDAASANMNLFRVWGGGFYESDKFYELCDKYGIMVWQDFPFSCNSSSEKETDKISLKEEVMDNVTRIRNHPSLVMLFCNSDISTYADFKSNKLLPKQNQVNSECLQFFAEDLPHIIHSICSIPFYSACSAKLNRENEGKLIRDWRVWYDAAPISVYSENQGGFFMEYGMQSFPDRKTLSITNNSDDWGLFFPSANASQFCQLPWISSDMNGNQLIMDYLQMYYNQPIDYPSATYLSQLFQAETINSAIEAHRIRKPFCMGTIFWHFNDCWPGITWSCEDYYNRQKPAYFAIRKAFKNIKVVPERLYGDIRIWAVNDSSATFDGDCMVSLMDFNGKTLFTKKMKVAIPSDQTQILWLINEENLVKGMNANKVLLNVILLKNNQIVDENILYFSEPRYLDLPVPDINYSIEPGSNNYLIKLISTRLAKNVVLTTDSIEVRFSDNNIDLLPNRSYTILADFNGTKQELENNLKIISLIDSY
jgi:beta-mannosidase